MIASIDLDAYFDRIRWGDRLRADYQTLSALLQRHMSAIPFENLDVLLGRPIRLDLESLLRKLVQARRGGYCFEHATLFAAVLEAAGFRPRSHLARVIRHAPLEASARTHMFLMLELPEGRFVVDPGFGALAPRVPVPLDATSVTIGGETHRMALDGQRWTMQGSTGDRFDDLWVTRFEEDFPVDFELGNHYTSSHPESRFKNRLMLRALSPGGRVSILDRDVAIWRDGAHQRQQLADRRALRALLAEHFGYDLAEVEALRVPMIPEWE